MYLQTITGSFARGLMKEHLKPTNLKISIKAVTNCSFQWLYYFAWCNDKHTFDESLDHQLCFLSFLHHTEEHVYQSGAERFKAF